MTTLPVETAQPTIAAPPPIPTPQPLAPAESLSVETVVATPMPPVSANALALRDVSAPVTVSQPVQRPVLVVATRSSR
ncbi:MAG: hypothetical protein J7463_04565 [Roseiflexus sp.]|nr:hypothetical protein [Roseiflexus sp.]MBO9334557.1 hypothetical protein [Roseiflexus sp.]MBO9341966.1 hypothetical protein [Roseiflexus sp.]MBO9383390.1 hypothetical protein [Roseiflexus sp.]MBO9387998.1 hypothetical protein [Roseiflexus sp.]